MFQLSDFEQAVLEKLLAGNHPVLATLREQIAQAQVVKRQNTGVGFFCDFEIGPTAPVVQGNFHIGDVHAEIESLERGVGFVLFIRDGKVKMLEGYTYDEPWPAEVQHFSLQYTEPDRSTELAKLTQINDDNK